MAEVRAGWELLQRGYGRNATFWPEPMLLVRKITPSTICRAFLTHGTHMWIEGEQSEIDLRDVAEATTRLAGYTWPFKATR